MFDITTVNQKATVVNSIEINAVSGTIIKSTPNSRIIRFHKKSEYASTFFDIENPHYRSKDYPYNSINVVVLQVMLCSNEEYLVEFLQTDK